MAERHAGRKYTVAKHPCSACPYRKDCPSGVWHGSEYEKLPDYDADTALQPTGLFLCHDGDAQERLCRGWVDVHGANELLSLRLAAAFGADVSAVYESAKTPTTVPLFASGAEACAHGKRDMDSPSVAAVRATAKLLSRHERLRVGADDDEQNDCGGPSGLLTGGSDVGIDSGQGELAMATASRTKKQKAGKKPTTRARKKPESGTRVRCMGTVSREIAAARRDAAAGSAASKIAAQHKISKKDADAIVSSAKVRGVVGVDEYSASDAAWLLGVTERRVRALCQSGRLKATLFGGWLWKIDAKAFRVFADEERVVGRRASAV